MLTTIYLHSKSGEPPLPILAYVFEFKYSPVEPAALFAVHESLFPGHLSTITHVASGLRVDEAPYFINPCPQNQALVENFIRMRRAQVGNAVFDSTLRKYLK